MAEAYPRRVWIEADGVGLAVHLDEPATPELVKAFEDLCRWIAAHPVSIREVIPNAETFQLTEAEAREAGDRQLERIERLRTNAARRAQACSSCGRETYRPDWPADRRQARRCMGCHRIVGRCTCEALGEPDECRCICPGCLAQDHCDRAACHA